MWHLVMLLALTVSLVNTSGVAASTAPAAPILVPTRSSCGAGAPSGLVLFHALDEAGRPVQPSLTLMRPDGAVRGDIDIPDPREIIPTQFGCRAVVISATGATYVVDGATGVVRELNLGDPANELRYDERAGGGRWGFFAGKYGEEQFALVDLVTGQVTDLRTLEPEITGNTTAQFSPDGKTLALSSSGDASGDGGGLWLIPSADPKQLRKVGRRAAGFLSFDEDGGRVLYREVRRDGVWSLVVEDTAEGGRTVVGSADRVRDDEPFLHGWFLPGRPELAVRFPDRIALVDPQGGRDRERDSVAGVFDWFWPAPSGQHGVVRNYVADRAEGNDAALLFVDLEQGAIQPLPDDVMAPLPLPSSEGVWSFSGRWLLSGVGGTWEAPQALASVDTETGAVTPLLPLAGRPNELLAVHPSRDGRLMLVVRSGDDGRHVTLLNAQAGTATEVIQARGVSADLSADGRWIAYTTVEVDGSERQTEVTFVETATGATTHVGLGVGPVWLAP